LSGSLVNILRRVFHCLFSVILLAGCSRLDSIPYTPIQTPQTWLAIQPWVEFRLAGRSLILVQPSTSALVYLLGLVTIVAGLYVLRIRNDQRTRLWWGIALLLWGLGALLAGTSYEAFSYQIKCLGRETCVWTSGWEIGYLLLSVASVNAMMIAQAYSCSTGRLRRYLMLFASLNMILYTLTVLIGMLVPVKFLISFELLILFAAPSILIFLALNGWRYYRLRQRSDLLLLITWAWLALTIGAYFLYYLFGLTQVLWARGVWFSENDVLHIGLILWMIYIAIILAPKLEDQSDRPYDPYLLAEISL
jgi:hypothetical protein